MSDSSAATASSTSYTATAAAYAHSLHSQRSRSLPSATSIKHFPKITLTAEEQAHYDRVVGRLLYRTVQEYANYRGEVSRELWSPVRKNHNMAIYRSVKSTSDPRVSLMIGVGKIDGSLEDVMDGLYAENTTQLRCVKALLKSKVFAGAVLSAIETRTPENPFTFAGIKWFAGRTAGGAVSCDRDFLTYERQGKTLDAEGNEVAYHLLQSVARPEWPANTFKSLLRSYSSICYLYKRRGNRVETFFLGEFYDSGDFPQRLADFSIAGKWLSVVNTVKCSQAKKLSQLRAVIAARNSQCSIMLSDVAQRSVFSAQQLCGACQQNVCRSCSNEAKLFELAKADRPLSDRFCHRCLAEVAKQRGSKIYGSAATEQPTTPAFLNFAFQASADSALLMDFDDRIDMVYLSQTHGELAA